MKPETDQKSAIKLGKVGLAFYTGPFWGFIGTVIGMFSAFGRLAESGQGETGQLSEDISLALWSKLAGLVLGLIGSIILFYAFKKGNRERWFYRYTVLFSVIGCFITFPLGLIFTVPLLLTFIPRRDEFGNGPGIDLLTEAT